MFKGISVDRILKMTNQEKRWFDNIKKAFYHSDIEMKKGEPEDRCLEELFKAIDTAKTLRRSLRGDDISHKNNRKKFIEFLALKIPCIKEELEAELEKRSGQLRLGDKIYKIRCKIHENENLNYEENVSYQVMLDWSNRDKSSWVENINDRFVFNGYFLWNRLREILSIFITRIDSVFSSRDEHTFCITINPQIGSIKHSKKDF